MAKPARSSAFETAASCVTNSSQSRPSSSIRKMPSSWPRARLRRFITGLISTSLSSIGIILRRSGEGSDGIRQALFSIRSNPIQCGIVGHRHHRFWIKSLNNRGGVTNRTDHDIAWQHCSDRWLDGDRLMGQGWPASTKDHLRLYVNVEFGLERCLHINLSEDTKTLFRKSGTHCVNSLVKRPVECGADRVPGHYA